eukprot:scaffold6641_cov35-Prasinocladus_malaysianus.AAC.1
MKSRDNCNEVHSAVRNTSVERWLRFDARAYYTRGRGSSGYDKYSRLWERISLMLSAVDVISRSNAKKYLRVEAEYYLGHSYIMGLTVGWQP